MKSSKETRWLKVAIAGISMAGVGACATAQADADLPTGYAVQSGVASFTQAGNALTIEASNKAIINYQQFNIGRQNQVNINSALSLHRVTGGAPSQILGQLHSTGKVFLVNPSGIIFASGARVNVQGLVASTLNIRDVDFLSDNYVFQREAGSQPAQIKNAGDIHATQSLALLAGAIENSGKLNAGKVALAVGDKIQIQANDLVAIDVTVTESLQEAVKEAETAIQNTGSISGQSINAQAKLAREFYKTTINNTGVIRAQGLAKNDRGEIVALGSTDDKLAVVENHGLMDASSSSGQGGSIHVLGDRVHIAGGELNASGATGGGEILVGGDYQGKNHDIYNAQMTVIGDNASLKADATQTGNGGKIIAWADDSTWSHGQISAKGINGGGFVETSGKRFLEVTEIPDISTQFGEVGTWLLDPNDLTIGAASTQTNINGSSPFVTTNDTATIGVGLITAALANGNVSISTGTGGTNSQFGDITISNAINYTGVGGRTLTFNAHRNINQNAAISSTNALNVTFIADSDANTTGNYVSNAAGSLTTNGGVVNINARAITLASTVNTGNANINLTSGTTMTATASLLTGTGVVNITAPTSTSINYNVASSPLNLGTLSSPAVTVSASGAGNSVTLNNGFNGTSLSVQTPGNIAVNGDITTSGNLDLRSNSGNVTVTGNVTDNSTTGTSYLQAGANSYTASTNLSISGALSIAGGESKNLTIYDGDGEIFNQAFFTNATARNFSAVDFRRADTNGVFNFSNFTGINPTSLTLVTTGANGHISLANGFNGSSLILQAQGAGSNITVGSNITTSGTLDVRSWSGNVTVYGNVSNSNTAAGTHHLQAGSSTFTASTNLSISGALSIAGAAGKSLTIRDGDGDIFNQAFFTDGSARAFSAVDFRRADTNGVFNFSNITGINPTSLTLVTTGANGHISLANGFNGSSLSLQAQGAGSNITVGSNITTSGTLDLRSWSGNVTVNGNVSNTAVGVYSHYLAAGNSTFSNATNLSISGTLSIAGSTNQSLLIYDGDGDIFTKAFFTDGSARAFSAVDFRRADTNGEFNFSNFTGINPTSLTLVTLGSNGHISLANSFNGTSLALRAQGTGSNITAGSNITTAGGLELRSFSGNVTVNGNLSNTANSAQSILLAAGTAGALSSTQNLTVTGNFSVIGGVTGKSLTVYDGDGDIFNKPFWSNPSAPLIFSTLDLRTGANDIGSLANPILLANATAPSLTLATPGSAYVNNTTGPLNYSGTGVGGTLWLRAAGQLATSGTTTAGFIDWATTANNGNIQFNNSATGTNGVTLATHGTGAVSIANTRTLAATNSPISITSRTFNMNTSAAISAGTGTVTLRPNDASAITVGAATKGSGFDLTASELSRITAQTLSIGDVSQAGDITLGGALNVSAAGSGAGRYNLDFKTGGAFNAAGNAITLGARDLSITTTGNITTAAVSGTTGSDVVLNSGGQLNVNNAISVDSAQLVAAQNVVLNSGSSITTSAAGNSLVVASTGGQFVNQSTSSALSATAGRWLVYSGDPALTNRGGLGFAFKRYNR
ncbi:MAG: filamentous hemagglutinin N-terminal domain-containing protein, partial [Vampirovibrionales bacterium]|nr:filamentous hemagglutinin N-terminal domain-containing protein [Vampirovibrionales bacterium]